MNKQNLNKKLNYIPFFVIVASFVFIAINSLFLLNNNYTFLLIPLFFLFTYLLFFQLKFYFFLSIFLIPLSIPLREIVKSNIGFDIFIPSEIFIIGGLFAFIILLLKNSGINKKIFYHPVTIAILFNLLWILLTAFTSTMFLVSIKFFLSRLWFVVFFYFFAFFIFSQSKNNSNIYKYLYLYIMSFLFLIIFILIKHYQGGLFDKQIAHFVVKPFFSDHTSYGATLALVLPILFFFMSKTKKNKIVYFLLILLFVLAVIFSYTRATWVSLIAALGLFIILKLRIKVIYILSVFTVLIILFFSFQVEIFQKLEKNKQDSSGELSEHVSSITNIATDASNMERLNRWSCAIDMFRAKPLFGYGPGTYSFQYAPYQLSYNKSVISTNFGSLGNAHSEYLGPLAESGIIGLLSFLTIIILVFYYSIKNYSNTKNKDEKNLILFILLALFTYLIHGLLNNFLDLDKTSALFWGYIGILVYLDLKKRKMLIVGF